MTSTSTPSDEDVGRQIIGVFSKYKVQPGGILRRNYFTSVRDGDFQRGLNKVVEKNWITIKKRDRHKYELTEAGFRTSQ
jgi:DNA-binding PadR family transcriptional regulator